jgi:hypothetical protein
MNEKIKLEFTDFQLDVIYNALDEYRNSIDDELEIEAVNDVQYNIFKACSE